MDTLDIRQLKMTWLAATEAGDTHTMVALLRDHPQAQNALVDFILASSIACGANEEEGLLEEAILPLTLRACQAAINRVFGETLAVQSLRELRIHRGHSLVLAARGLQLGVDVWKKFEDGLIDYSSIGKLQLERLARFFQISAEQFENLLANSRPTLSLNRRQTLPASLQSQQSPKKQSLAEAIHRSTMSAEERRAWL
jgi:hypothetical protein